MIAYVLRRLVQAVPVLIGVSLVAFVLVRFTGDPAALMLGEAATPDAVAEFREQNGLNDPLPVQYVRFLADAVRGDLGHSIRHRAPAAEVVLERLPATLQLAGASLLFAIVIGLPLGVIAAVKWDSPFDHAIRGFVFIGQAVPAFYLGILLILIFAVRLQWLPTGGNGTWKHLIMPTLTLGMYLLAVVARFTRAAVLEVLRLDYVRTARSKGLAEGVIIRRPALKNALLPLITVLGLQIGALLGGAVITETIFAWPGIGWLAFQAITARDFPVVQAVVLLAAVNFVLVNLVVDVLYAYVDPRIRLS